MTYGVEKCQLVYADPPAARAFPAPDSEKVYATLAAHTFSVHFFDAGSGAA